MPPQDLQAAIAAANAFAAGFGDRHVVTTVVTMAKTMEMTMTTTTVAINAV